MGPGHEHDSEDGAMEGDSDPQLRTEFERRADERRVGLAAEFWEFLKYNKKWWLLPILLVFLVLGVLVLLTSSAPAALPFIYTLF